MSSALLAACALVLLASAAGHLRRPGALASGLAAHGLVPAGLRTPLAWAVPAVELVLGAGAGIAAVAGRPAPALGAALAAALLFTAMTAYLHAARGRAPRGVPCACGVGEAPLGLWVTMRAGILAGLALASALSAGLALAADAGGTGTAWGFAGRPWPEVVVLASASLALAIGIALLPAARTPQAHLTLAATRPGFSGVLR